MKIAVIAMGKIGLPMAVQFALKGHQVIGVDVSADTIKQINAGLEPFPGEAELAERLATVVSSGALVATTNYAEAIPGADVVVVLVPLVVDDDTWAPDFSMMDQATQSIATHLTPGTLISYETTLPVGTLRGRFRPMIESISGMEEGRDFHMVFSPERVFTGRLFADLRRYPKLVGGLSDEGKALGVSFYESVLDFDDRDDLPQPNGVWDMGSAEAAEMAKLAETTYRDVNIGLANEFAKYADSIGVDIYKVISACNSQPFSHIHRPGIAVGGHCIPVYPRLYLSKDPHAAIVRTAREVNMTMPVYTVGLAAKLWAEVNSMPTPEAGDTSVLDGVRVVVLGAAFRGNVKETAFSGVFEVVAQLRMAGAQVSVHDPLFTDDELVARGFTPFHLSDSADIVILQADHADYLTWDASMIPSAKVLIDGRNVTDPKKWAGVRRACVGKLN